MAALSDWTPDTVVAALSPGGEPHAPMMVASASAVPTAIATICFFITTSFPLSS